MSHIVIKAIDMEHYKKVLDIFDAFEKFYFDTSLILPAFEKGEIISVLLSFLAVENSVYIKAEVVEVDDEYIYLQRL